MASAVIAVCVAFVLFVVFLVAALALIFMSSTSNKVAVGTGEGEKAAVAVTGATPDDGIDDDTYDGSGFAPGSKGA